MRAASTVGTQEHSPRKPSPEDAQVTGEAGKVEASMGWGWVVLSRPRTEASLTWESFSRDGEHGSRGSGSGDGDGEVGGFRHRTKQSRTGVQREAGGV